VCLPQHTTLVRYLFSNPFNRSSVAPVVLGVPQYNPNAIRDFRSRMMLKVHDKDLPEGTPQIPAFPLPALSLGRPLPRNASSSLFHSPPSLHFYRTPAIDKLIAKSYNHSGTNLYDSFQLATNGIAK